MEEENKQIHNHFEAGSQPQIFQGNISGAIFAMPGAVVNQYAAPVKAEVTPPIEESHPSLSDAEVLDKLLPLFYSNRAIAQQFLESIHNAKGPQITELVNNLVKERKLSSLSCHRDLWKILYDHGLYHATESNWNRQIRF